MQITSWLKENISIVLFILFLSLAVYFEDAPRTYSIIAALAVMALSKQENVAVCFIVQAFMCDNLVLLPSLSFSSVAALVFILKCMVFGKDRKLLNKGIAVVVVITVIQSLSILIYENTLINVLRLAVNLIVLLYYSNYSMVFKSKSPALIPSMISITVLIACIIGLGKSASPDDFGVLRYSGIWIDDNFCGMYCLLGIISSAYAVFISRKTLIFAIPSALFCFYMASLSMSRSFLYVMVIIAFFTFLSFSKNKSLGALSKIIVYCVFVIGAYYFIIDVALPIIDARGYVETGSEDVTNGRIALVQQSLSAFSDNPLAWLFGAGTSNTEHFKFLSGVFPKMSHNTYVDVLVEFGIVVFVLIIIFVIKFLLKAVRSVSQTIPYSVLFSIVVLCYMGTLTMGQYSILFIALGMMNDFLSASANKQFVNINTKH